MGEIFLVLNAVGGECLDDFQHLRDAAGVHRNKPGTIEGIPNALKNDLTAGALPSKHFGASAAWLRLAVVTHNVLTALKQLALPPELLAAHPTRLRFLFFYTAGRIVRHAREMLCEWR